MKNYENNLSLMDRLRFCGNFDALINNKNCGYIVKRVT